MVKKGKDMTSWPVVLVECPKCGRRVFLEEPSTDRNTIEFFLQDNGFKISDSEPDDDGSLFVECTKDKGPDNNEEE